MLGEPRGYACRHTVGDQQIGSCSLQFEQGRCKTGMSKQTLGVLCRRFEGCCHADLVPVSSENGNVNPRHCAETAEQHLRLRFRLEHTLNQVRRFHRASGAKYGGRCICRRRCTLRPRIGGLQRLHLCTGARKPISEKYGDCPIGIQCGALGNQCLQLIR